MKERMSQSRDRCRDKIGAHCVLAQRFLFYSVSKVTSVSQKFKTKRDKASELLETEQVSEGLWVTRGCSKKESEVEGE